MPMLLVPALALAAEVILRNDTAYTDEYDQSDQVAWLDYPECAIAVFTPDEADLPLSIDYVQVYLGSNTGNQDGDDTMMDVGLQILEDGEEPSLTHFEWGPEAFYATVSSTSINELYLVDSYNGLYALDFTAGRLAVWVCAPDPITGEAWPRANDADTSGIVIDTASPSAGNYLYYQDRVQPLQNFVRGSWIIRAKSSTGGDGDADTDTDADTDADADTDTDTDIDPVGDVQVTSITPAAGRLGEAVDVAIVGSGFDAQATVTIGGAACGSVVVSGDSAITARTPTALPAGTHDVVVTNPDGSSDTLEAAFTVTDGCGCGVGAPASLVAAALGGLLAGARRKR